MRRPVLAGLAVLVLGGAAWWMSQPATPVRGEGRESSTPVPVVRKDLARWIEAVGVVEPAFVLDVKSKASGEITTVSVEEGDSVPAGALLVELLPVDEERNLRRQRSLVASAEAELAKTRSQLKQAELSLEVGRSKVAAQLAKARVENELAKAELQRQESLHQRQLASQQNLEVARRTSEAAHATLELASAEERALDLAALDVQARRHDITLREAGLERERIALEISEIRLVETRILAPMPGLVLKKHVERGQIIASGISNVQGGTALVTLADVSRLFLDADVDESDIGGVAVGQEVELSAEAYPDRTFEGRVHRISPRGEAVQNVTIFRVRIELLGNALGKLRPGMNATARILQQAVKGALTVPSAAIRRREGRTGVLVATESGRPQFVPVELGLRQGAEVEVRGSLEPGQKVLVPGAEGAGAAGRGGGNGGGNGQRGMMRGMRMMGS